MELSRERLPQERLSKLDPVVKLAMKHYLLLLKNKLP
jgi:hypothetical protein